jgi:hypothetical protein
VELTSIVPDTSSVVCALTDSASEAAERLALINLMVGARARYKNPQRARCYGSTQMIMLASHRLKIVASRG